LPNGLDRPLDSGARAATCGAGRQFGAVEAKGLETAREVPPEGFDPGGTCFTFRVWFGRRLIWLASENNGAGR